jgi:hypothetical protein
MQSSPHPTPAFPWSGRRRYRFRELPLTKGIRAHVLQDDQNMKLACSLLLMMGALCTAGCTQHDDNVVRPRLLADGAARISHVDPLLQAAMEDEDEEKIELRAVNCRSTEPPSMPPRLVIPACDVTADDAARID